MLLVGAFFVYGGIKLIALGGSFYYLPAGIALIAAAVLLLRSDMRGAYLYAIFFVVTALWALWEGGLQFWPLAARLGMFAVIGLLVAIWVLVQPSAQTQTRLRQTTYGVAGVTILGLVAAFVSSFSPIWLVKPTYKPLVVADYKPDAEPDNWVGFGRTTTGEQFAPYNQITRDNIKNLTVAWTFHTGDISGN